MRVLITGGAGFIGSHTADALLSRGYEVRVLDSLEPPVHRDRRWPGYLDQRIERVEGDVRDAAALLEALRGCDVVYHLAAFQDYLPVFSRFFDVNVTSTALIYEIIIRERLPVSKVIVASSQATLGEGLYSDADGKAVLPDIRPDSQLKRGVWEVQPSPGFRGPLRWQESDERIANPQNQYGISKIAEEKIALHLGKRYEIPTVAMRYSIVQGPRQSFYNAYSGACRIFCLSFHQGVEPVIFEDGEQVRDFVNIQDVVSANVQVLEDPRADYEMFNVGGGRACTVSDFAKVVADVFGHANYQPRPSGKYRFGDTRHIFSDISKLRRLGWKPQRGTHDSVEAYKLWMRDLDSAAGILRQCQEQMASMDVVRSVKALG